MTDTDTAVLEPLTDGDPFPETLVDTTILRQRVGALSPEGQQQALTVWQAAGLPAARDADGNSVLLPATQHRQISEIVRGQEQPATEAARGTALGLLAALSMGERSSVHLSASAHAIVNASTMLMTDGEAMVIGLLVEACFAAREEDEQPACAELPPLDDRPGRVVPVAVGSEEELDLIPPTGKIDDIMAWVAGDPAKAAAALAAEYDGKRRKGLISKLTPLAPAAPAPPPVDGETADAEPLEVYDNAVPPAPGDDAPPDLTVDENGDGDDVDAEPAEPADPDPEPEPAEPADPDPEPEPTPATPEQGDVLITLEHLRGALGTVQTLLEALTHQISNNRGDRPTDHTGAEEGATS